MSSTVSKQKMQKLMDEIEELKRTNRDHEDQIQYLEKKNCDLDSLNALIIDENEIYKAENQRLEQENHELVSDKTNLATKIEEYKDEIKKLTQENHELVSDKTNLATKIEEYNDEIKILKQENHELVSDKTNLATKIEEYKDEIQKLKQGLYAKEVCESKLNKFDNLAVYNRISTSPAVNKDQECAVWWCPKHSEFDTIVKDFKPENEIDSLKIKRGKARNAYWKKKNDEHTCCQNDRTNKDRNHYSPPSNWPK